QSEDALASEDRAREALLMGLRLHEGVDLARIAGQSGVALSRLVDESAITQLTGIGLLRHHGTQLQVTPAGLLLLDAILPQVVAI
ncbi:MAG: coproporphyrinogen III oxidase, partial [Sphingobium sp.]|nr:coproporphyrinogen III oxidase [Sphingobium sp.]